MTSSVITLEEQTDLALKRKQEFFQRFGVWLFVAVFGYAAIGNSPFSPLELIESVEDDGGDIVNKIAWAAFASLSIVLGVQADHVAARRLLVRAWPIWLVMAWVLASIGWADYPDLALRRGGRLLIVAMTGFGLALMMPHPARFMRLMLVVTGVVMAINILGTLALPGIAIGDSGIRGMHSHKNTAGQVALVAVLTWMVAASVLQDLRMKVLAMLMTALLAGFLVLTQSKTAIGVVAIVPLLLLAGNLVMRAGRLAGWMLTALFAAAGLGIWATFMALGWGFDDIGLFLFGDLTFTGRTSLWSFIATKIKDAPLLGVGYGSFWQTGLRFSVLEFTNEWFANANQSHNGYLDLILQIGYIGFGLALITVVASLVQSLRLLGREGISSYEQGAYLMALALLLSAVLMNFMETSYFRASGYLATVFIFVYFAVVRWSMDATTHDEPIGSDRT